MEALNPILTGYAVAAISIYAIWFYFISRRLTGPKVLPIVGSLPYLIANRNRVHDWIADNLRATGGTQAMARWVNGAIKNRLWLILDRAVKDNKPVDLQDLFLRLTFDNICGLTFGKDPETLSPDLPVNPFSVAFDTATEATLKRLLMNLMLVFIENPRNLQNVAPVSFTSIPIFHTITIQQT
ncbi:hypothetical protein Bca52824_006354 [Brassica carinata]|uniref:Cytochrome P450 n=1 Tax=Brassica carinata TaxID=52824 RepID=A0A8X7WQA8_BRACI|nr:hypothetical protein Bca52824_006354 [Brassica carinata]